MSPRAESEPHVVAGGHNARFPCGHGCLQLHAHRSVHTWKTLSNTMASNLQQMHRHRAYAACARRRRRCLFALHLKSQQPGTPRSSPYTHSIVAKQAYSFLPSQLSPTLRAHSSSGWNGAHTQNIPQGQENHRFVKYCTVHIINGPSAAAMTSAQPRPFLGGRPHRERRSAAACAINRPDAHCRQPKPTQRLTSSRLCRLRCRVSVASTQRLTSRRALHRYRRLRSAAAPHIARGQTAPPTTLSSS